MSINLERADIERTNNSGDNCFCHVSTKINKCEEVECENKIQVNLQHIMDIKPRTTIICFYCCSLCTHLWGE